MPSSAERLEVTSVSTLVLVVLMLVWMLITRSRNSPLPPSAVACLLGLATGVCVLVFQRYLGHGVVHRMLAFDSSWFLVYLLPPVIFNAGLSAQKQLFFSNLGTILVMGVLGTVASFLIITVLLSILTVSDLLRFQDCLALAAIFSATDSVATLQVLDPNSMPLLFAVVSGEGIINDATSVVLFGAVARVFPPGGGYSPPPPSLPSPATYPSPLSPAPTPDSPTIDASPPFNNSTDDLINKILSPTEGSGSSDGLGHAALRLLTQFVSIASEGTDGSPLPSSSSPPTSHHELGLIGSFLYLYSLSTIMGLATGLLIAFLLKNVQSSGAYREICLVGLLSYMSYLAAELAGLSGILCLFCCGLAVSQWALPRMSSRGSAATIDAFHALSHLAEGIIFMYLGMDALDPMKWQATYPGEVAPLCVSLLLLLAVSRAVGVVPLALLHNLWGAHPLSRRDAIIIWWSGLARGAVSVALVYYYFDPGNAEDGHRATIISSTLVTVLFTTLVFGVLTKPLMAVLLDERLDNPLLKILAGWLQKGIGALPLQRTRSGYQAVSTSQTAAPTQPSPTELASINMNTSPKRSSVCPSPSRLTSRGSGSEVCRMTSRSMEGGGSDSGGGAGQGRRGGVGVGSGQADLEAGAGGPRQAQE